MWHKIDQLEPAKWVKTDDHGRIMARIVLKDGEYVASKVEVDPDGIGHSKSKGCYINIDTAKAAVE